MARHDVNGVLGRIDKLEKEIIEFVPMSPRTIEFRADLAGLLVVAIAASYEACVKETLVRYANQYHPEFGIFAQNQFKRLNSRVRLHDLHGYTKTFGDASNQKFGTLVRAHRHKIRERVGIDIVQSYEQILNWRHDFAHEGVRNTTVEEAMATHRRGKRVLYLFDAAFG